MELYRKVRLACREGMSERATARHFGGLARDSGKASAVKVGRSIGADIFGGGEGVPGDA